MVTNAPVARQMCPAYAVNMVQTTMLYSMIPGSRLRRRRHSPLLACTRTDSSDVGANGIGVASAIVKLALIVICATDAIACEPAINGSRESRWV